MNEDMLEKTLITGAGGALGSYADFGIRKDRDTLDITNIKNVFDVFRDVQPKAVIHLAAATDMGACEKDPGQAYLVNAAGTYHLALAAREVGARFIYVSSAGIFDGKKEGPYRETDTPNPPNIYGHSKYLGELAVRGLLEDYVIVRTCWIFGGGADKDKKFVGRIMAQLKDPAKTELKGTNDEIGSPTYGKDLMAALKTLVQGPERGILNVANTGGCSRYDVLKAIAAQVAPQVSTVPVPLSLFNPTVGITMNQVLAVRPGLMRPWEVALKGYLQNEWPQS